MIYIYICCICIYSRKPEVSFFFRWVLMSTCINPHLFCLQRQGFSRMLGNGVHGGAATVGRGKSPWKKPEILA